MKGWMKVVLVAGIAALWVLAAGFAPSAVQAYQPKSGETVLVLDVEGKGEVVISLATREAPKTTAQIIKLAQSGFYNGQKFFRVVKTPRPFLAQFGDPQTKEKDVSDASIGTGGSGTTVPFENTGLKNVEGAVGLSLKENDKATGDSQFYINLAANGFLDGGYSVFGQVVKGMDIVKNLNVGDKVSTATIKRG